MHDLHYSRPSASSRAALTHVLALARRQEAVSQSYIAETLRRTGSQIATYRAAMACIQAHARVVIRIGTTSIPVVSALLKEGVYRNQFETGLSAGSRSAFPGGARDSWERVLFRGRVSRERRQRLGTSQVRSAGAGSLC